MTTRARWLLASPIALGCLVFGTAFAQTTTPAATVDVNAGSNVSSADQLKQSTEIVGKMQTSSTRVRHMLDDARRQKDVVKTTCLSDKLAQIEVALKSARDRQGSLQSAASRGDNDLRNHEFSVMSVLRQRAEQLDAEANQCIGEELGFPGETKITWSVDPNIAPVDPGTGTGDNVVIVPPLPASGFQ